MLYQFLVAIPHHRPGGADAGGPPRSLVTITRLVTTIPVAGIKAETNLS